MALAWLPLLSGIKCFNKCISSRFVDTLANANLRRVSALSSSSLHRLGLCRPEQTRNIHNVAINRRDSSTFSNGTSELPQANADEARVAIGWHEGVWSRYHHIWLRDHCRCSECFHSITKQRLLDTFSIPPDVHPASVTPKPEGLEVIWKLSPPHTSLYPWDWLRRNSYDPPITKASTIRAGTVDSKILWNSKIQKDPPNVTFEEVMNDDRGVLKWLEKIDRFGFCFVTGVPVTTEDTEKLARRISFIRETQYGGFWDFTSDLSHGDTAYTSIALPAHTDNTYFTDPCGLQLFHLLSHTGGSGGQTLLVDGFYAASILKELQPSSYNLLSTISIPAHAAGDPNSIYRPTPTTGYPVLVHDNEPDGELRQVRWNNDDRSVIKWTDTSLVVLWYDAIRHWNACLKSPDSEFWVQLSPGTAVIVDNHRVLHGRSAFTGKRRMCGAYIGRDDYRARLDALRGRFSQGKEETQREIWDALF